jgi:hypothetical protein
MRPSSSDIVYNTEYTVKSETSKLTMLTIHKLIRDYG